MCQDKLVNNDKLFKKPDILYHMFNTCVYKSDFQAQDPRILFNHVKLMDIFYTLWKRLNAPEYIFKKLVSIHYTFNSSFFKFWIWKM